MLDLAQRAALHATAPGITQSLFRLLFPRRLWLSGQFQPCLRGIALALGGVAFPPEVGPLVPAQPILTQTETVNECS